MAPGTGKAGGGYPHAADLCSSLFPDCCSGRETAGGWESAAQPQLCHGNPEGLPCRAEHLPHRLFRKSQALLVFSFLRWAMSGRLPSKNCGSIPKRSCSCGISVVTRANAGLVNMSMSVAVAEPGPMRFTMIFSPKSPFASTPREGGRRLQRKRIESAFLLRILRIKLQGDRHE